MFIANKGFCPKINPKSIKEVVFSASTLAYAQQETDYSEILRITKRMVSYKRRGYLKTNNFSWSYKTTNEMQINKFYDLCNTAAIIAIDYPSYEMYDCPKFSVVLKLKDGKQVELNGAFGAHLVPQLVDLVIALLGFVPKGERCPGMLYRLYESEEMLTKKVLDSINPDSINGFMYAEGGAMGNPGEVCLLANNTMYTADCMTNECDICLDDVIEKLEGFRNNDMYRCQVKNLTINDMPWIYINLGAGNHLYLRADIYIYVCGLLSDPFENVRYALWKQLINERD